MMNRLGMAVVIAALVGVAPPVRRCPRYACHMDGAGVAGQRTSGPECRIILRRVRARTPSARWHIGCLGSV